MLSDITTILLIISVLILWIAFVIHIDSAEGIQVKKCTFWVFMCHMEEHYIENCEVGEWLRKDHETYYNSFQVGSSNIMVPYEVEYDIYRLTCTKVFDNGTEVTRISEKRM